MAGSKMEMDPDVLRSTAKKIENSAADMGKRAETVPGCDRRFKQYLEQ